MAELKHFVIGENDCFIEGMTKEEIYAAIAETTGNTPTGVDSAFITKLVNQNGGTLKLWRGTTAEYNALETKDADTIYVRTDAVTAEEAYNRAFIAETQANAAMALADNIASDGRAAMPGDIKFKAAPVVDVGWLLCDGSSYGRSQYPELFNVIGTRYVPEGQENMSTFCVPNMVYKFPLATIAEDVGDEGGEENHVLTIEEMPKHRHNIKNIWEAGSGTGTKSTIKGYPTTNKSGQYEMISEYIGEGKAHNNMPPYMKLYCLIKY